MNEKEKAEAYVKSKCPELMELSFGCVVTNGINKWVVLVYPSTGLPEVVPYINGEAHAFNRMGFKGHLANIKPECEIIGHPIQLSHYNKVVIATAKWKGSELVKQAQVFWNMNMYWECEDWNNFYRYVCEQLEI